MVFLLSQHGPMLFFSIDFMFHFWFQKAPKSSLPGHLRSRFVSFPFSPLPTPSFSFFFSQALPSTFLCGGSGEGWASTKLAALYSATKSLQNSCTAKLQLFSSVLEAKQQLNSSCSGMQKRCAAFEALGSGFAVQLLTFKSCEVVAVTLQFSCARSDSTGSTWCKTAQNVPGTTGIIVSTRVLQGGKT